MTVDQARQWLRTLHEDKAQAELRLALLSPEHAQERLKEQWHIDNRRNLYWTIQAAITAAEKAVKA